MGEEGTGLYEAMLYAMNGDRSILLLPSGEVRSVPPPSNIEKGYSLGELHVFLDLAEDHYIEIVSVLHGISRMIVDDEGAITPLPVNPAATSLYRSIGGMTPIHGPALIVPWESIK